MQPYGVLYNYDHAFCVLQLCGELDGSLRDDLQYNIWNVIRLFMTIGLLLNTEIKFSTHDAFLE
jgi:hypothetical protein